MSESGEEMLSQAHAILDVVARLENRRHSPAGLGRGWEGVDRALVYAESTLRRMVAHGQPESQPDGWLANLNLLTGEVALLRNRILTHNLAMRGEMMHKADRALQLLRAAGSEREFSELLPTELVKLGFVRAMYSTVNDMRWVTRSVHTVNGENERQLLLRAGQQPPFRELRGLFEYEMIQQGKAMLQQGIRKSPRVHPELIEITESDSYVSAPLVAGRLVTGFVSLDVNAATGSVDGFDRDLVGLICGGAGIALERIRALEGIGQLHAGIEQSMESMRAIMRGNGVDTLSVKGADKVRDADFDGVDDSEVLTRRENQVLRLLARGQTNSEIGQRLFISEGTAKTHVRNILRKLGASNRTQAAEIFRQQP